MAQGRSGYARYDQSRDETAKPEPCLRSRIRPGRRRGSGGRPALQREVAVVPGERFGQLSKIEVARMTGLSVQSSFGDHESTADRRAAAARSAGARTRRPADRAGVARSRRRLFARAEDRPAQLRSRADRLLRRDPPPRQEDFCLSDARHRASISSRPLAEVTERLTPAQARRIAGLGIASPFQLWSWSAEIGAPTGAMDGWRNFSIADELGRLCPYPITLCNDATSACAAEFFFGEAWRERDFLYFFIGVFLGGGLVLDGALYAGRTGNAAALGSMPIPSPDGARRLAIDCLGLDLSTGTERRGGGARSVVDLA